MIALAAFLDHQKKANAHLIEFLSTKPTEIDEQTAKILIPYVLMFAKLYPDSRRKCAEFCRWFVETYPDSEVIKSNDDFDKELSA